MKLHLIFALNAEQILKGKIQLLLVFVVKKTQIILNSVKIVIDLSILKELLKPESFVPVVKF